MSGDSLGPDTSRLAARAILARSFRQAGIASPEVDARILVCAGCAIDHAALIRDPDARLGEEAATAISAMARRRCAREPVSRILGRREFWGIEFHLSPAVLDPRPDTEELVAAVLGAIGPRRDAALRVLDLGTGSGAVLCALLAELPHATGLGIDRSTSACVVASGNAKRAGLDRRSAFLCADWLDAIRPMPSPPFNIVVSNPPYVRTEDIQTLDPEVRSFDPRAALDGGDDGLDPYRTIMRSIRPFLAPDGLIAVECGHGQANDIAALMSVHGLDTPSIRADLAGRDRVVIARLEPLRHHLS